MHAPGIYTVYISISLRALFNDDDLVILYITHSTGCLAYIDSKKHATLRFAARKFSDFAAVAFAAPNYRELSKLLVVSILLGSTDLAAHHTSRDINIC